jgi:hypothetical protein
MTTEGLVVRARDETPAWNVVPRYGLTVILTFWTTLPLPSTGPS